METNISVMKRSNDHPHTSGAAPSLEQLDDDALVAWFGEAGLDVTVVHRCPVRGCDVCDRHVFPAAA